MTTKNTDLLFEAARDGNAEEIRRLIPISDPKNNDSMALQVAASYGHTECVKLLIPVSDPKANNSCALRAAVLYGHTQCVDAHGVSDVHASLKHLQQNNMNEYPAWRSFEQRVEAERQYLVLSKEVGEGIPARKHQM